MGSLPNEEAGRGLGVCELKSPVKADVLKSTDLSFILISQNAESCLVPWSVWFGAVWSMMGMRMNAVQKLDETKAS